MKKYQDSHGREVVDLEVEGQGVDAFLQSAAYADTGEPVPEDELDYLTDAYRETIDEIAFENAVVAAEYAFEGDR